MLHLTTVQRIDFRGLEVRHDSDGFYAGVATGDIVGLVLCTLLLCRNLKEFVVSDIVDVYGLGRTGTCAEDEIDKVVVAVDGILLGIPLLALDGGCRCHLVARPALIGRCMAVVTSPCPEVDARPAYLVGIHIDGDGA